MPATPKIGRGFAAHVHAVVDLDEHGASLGAVETSIDAMNVGVEEQTALRVLASSLHTGANANQEVDRSRGGMRTPSAALRVADAEIQAQQGTERWVNEGGSLGPEAAVPTPLRDASPLGSERDVATSKWSWHDDLREVEHW